ncbi:MAG: hypothetical protein HKN72_16665 [Gemmatimonadetes bacterium]|nr:hypothetical protein [Gemmatimonadota bacterium]
MSGAPPRTVVVTALLTMVLTPGVDGQQPRVPDEGSTPLFADDFESGLTGWRFPYGSGHVVVEYEGNRALRLETASLPVLAVVVGSDSWGDVRIEGRVLFSDDEHNYLGFIYRYGVDDGRIDFGSVYIKGNGSYLQANPHYDTNVGRTVYPELRADLTGRRAIRIGEWQTFALEVVGAEAHLYVGDLNTPAMTLPASASPRGPQGSFGFKPRNPGAAVLIDDIRVTDLREFRHQGPRIPDAPYDRPEHATEWNVLGPLTRHAPDVETASATDLRRSVASGGRVFRWRPFEADERGAVVTGRVVDFRGDDRVAYFHTAVESDTERVAELHLSTVDDLAIWVNGVFVGFAARQAYAWWDAGSNPEHPPLRSRVTLQPGTNHVIVRVVGGTYATGGFFLRVVDPG